MKLSQKHVIGYAYLRKKNKEYDELLTKNNLWELFRESKYTSKFWFLRSQKLV